LQSIQHRLAGGQRRLLTRLRAPPVVGCCGICARPATAFVRACAGRCHGLFASVRRGDDCARGAVRGLIGIASCPHHRRLGRLVPHKPPGSPNRTDPGARDKREAPAGTRLFECQLVEGKYEHPCGLSRRRLADVDRRDLHGVMRPGWLRALLKSDRDGRRPRLFR
jgi:hypothetical protein